MSNSMNTTNFAETSSASAASVAAKSLEQTVVGLQDGVARASAGVEQTQAKLKEGAAQAMNKAAEVVRFNQGNIEALTKSTQIWAAGVQELSTQVAASLQTSLQETMGAFKTLAGAKSLRQVIELQSGFSRAALEKAVAEQKQLTAASLQLTKQTLAPITERVKLVGETFTKTV